eukprot:11168800-Alexandrium_andersonii.AAC.1
MRGGGDRPRSVSAVRSRPTGERTLPKMATTTMAMTMRTMRTMRTMATWATLLLALPPREAARRPVSPRRRSGRSPSTPSPRWRTTRLGSPP